MLARETVWWFYAVALLEGLLKAEKPALSSIGLCLPTGKIVGFGLLATPRWLRVGAVLRAAVVEELICLG